MKFLHDDRNVTTLPTKKTTISEESSFRISHPIIVAVRWTLFTVYFASFTMESSLFATLGIPFALDEVKIIPLAPSRNDVRLSSRFVALQCRVSAELELKLLLLILICDS